MRTAQLAKWLGRAPELLAVPRHTHAAAPLVLRYLQVGKHTYPYTLRLTNGATFTFASPEEVKVFWQIYVRGCYTLPARCETILDCGANIGIFSVWAASQRPSSSIVALEPFAPTFAALQAHIRDNRLQSRVTCVPIGVAGESGERWIQIGSNSPRVKVLPANGPTPTDHVAPIRCLTLAETLRQYGLEQLDLLKMDIEGSEYEVLLSTPPEVLAGIRHIQLEYHEVAKRFHHTPEELIAHLGRAGHRLVWRTEDAHRTGLAYFERT